VHRTLVASRNNGISSGVSGSILSCRVGSDLVSGRKPAKATIAVILRELGAALILFAKAYYNMVCQYHIAVNGFRPNGKTV